MTACLKRCCRTPYLAQAAQVHTGASSSTLCLQFYKHGSCIGGSLSTNKTAFFSSALTLAKSTTASGTATANLIAAYRCG